MFKRSETRSLQDDVCKCKWRGWWGRQRVKVQHISSHKEKNLLIKFYKVTTKLGKNYINGAVRGRNMIREI